MEKVLLTQAKWLDNDLYRNKNNVYSFNKVKFFVTCGADFIGSYIVRYLVNSLGFDVINVDKLTNAGNLESLNTIETSERYFFEQIDIRDLERLKIGLDRSTANRESRPDGKPLNRGYGNLGNWSI